MQPEYRAKYDQSSVDRIVLADTQEDSSGGFFVMVSQPMAEIPDMADGTKRYKADAQQSAQEKLDKVRAAIMAHQAQQGGWSDATRDAYDAAQAVFAQATDGGPLGVYRKWMSVPTSEHGCEWWHLRHPYADFGGRFCCNRRKRPQAFLQQFLAAVL